jgi:hypothetical protein
MFDKNYYQKKLNEEYQKFGKKKDSLLNDVFQLIDRGREELMEISKTAKELEEVIKEETKVEPNPAAVEVKDGKLEVKK